MLLEDLVDQRALDGNADFVDHFFDLLSVEHAALVPIGIGQFAVQLLEVDRADQVDVLKVLLQQFAKLPLVWIEFARIG